MHVLVLDSMHFRKGTSIAELHAIPHELICVMKARTITYDEAMELEIRRLKLGLSAAQRDHALIASIGRDPASIDPNKLLSPSYLFQVRSCIFILFHMLSETLLG